MRQSFSISFGRFGKKSPDEHTTAFQVGKMLVEARSAAAIRDG
jgi:hypothetical protein